jgi:hypothetical protein
MQRSTGRTDLRPILALNFVGDGVQEAFASSIEPQ